MKSHNYDVILIQNYTRLFIRDLISMKMHKGQVTIKDIAKELGISPSTVSRALKDHPDISADTKKAVQELALKWNYKPDPIALSLKSRKSKIIRCDHPRDGTLFLFYCYQRD